MTELPILKNYTDHIAYINDMWNYINEKYWGSRLRRPAVFRLMHNANNAKVYGRWIPQKREMCFTPKIFNNEVVARAIIYHEFAHQVADELYGEKYENQADAHGETWQLIMKRMEQKPDRQLSCQDVVLLRSKKEREQLDNFKMSLDDLAKIAKPFSSQELNACLGLCGKFVDASKSNKITLCRLICRRVDGKILALDELGNIWTLKKEHLFKATGEESKEIKKNVSDALLLKGEKWYKGNLEARRARAQHKKEIMDRYGLLAKKVKF